MKPFTAKIAGRRHHPGVVNASTMIQLVLAPSPAHPQAIAVLADGATAGYIEAGLAPLLAPRLRRGGIVIAAPMGDRVDAIHVYVGTRGDRLAGPHPTIVSVESSSAEGGYAVDLRAGYCTCPAGRYARCKHKDLFGPEAS